MQIDDFLLNGMVRRWSLVDGQPRCVEDAVDSNLPQAMLALQKNFAIRAMVNLVEGYEAAQSLVARGEPDNGQPKKIPDPQAMRPEGAPDDWAAPLIDNPDWSLLPRTFTTLDTEGNPVVHDEPLWTAYDAAQAIIAAASPVTVSLARWRAAEASRGHPEESVAEDEAEAEGSDWEADRDAVMAYLATEAAKTLAVDPRPVPNEISRRQFAQACVALGYMTKAEGRAFVTTNTTPAAMATAIAGLNLPADTIYNIEITVEGSAKFERLNPATSLLMSAMQRSAADRDAIWRLGATFP